MGKPDQPRGSDGKWIPRKSIGVVIGAGLLAALMSAAGGGDAVTSVGAGLDAASSEAAADEGAAADQSTVDRDTASSRKDAARGDDVDAWEKLAVKQIKKEITKDLRCAVQSFGAVQQFFLKNPCDKLNQRLYALVDIHGNILVGSVMWVTMSSEETATEFKKLEDVYGTGDVTPFGTEALELGGIHFTGKHYRSRRDGSMVVISETEPVHGQPSSLLLQEAATVADVFPPPR
jgi:hypothetical protein